jgi:hypothetical protein
MAVPMLINLALSLPLVLESCSVRIGELASAVWRPYAGAMLMSVVLFALRPELGLPVMARVAITASIGCAIYVGWLMLISRQWTFATVRLADAK